MWTAALRWLIAHTTFLETYKDRLGPGAAVLGVVIGILGFWLTAYQIGRTTAALQASNSYQVQKDARDLAEKVRADPAFATGLSASGPHDATQFSFEIWRLANFYLAVYRFHKAYGLSDDFYKSYAEDFCGLFGNKNFETSWDSMIADKRLNDSEKSMREDWCDP